MSCTLAPRPLTEREHQSPWQECHGQSPCCAQSGKDVLSLAVPEQKETSNRRPYRCSAANNPVPPQHATRRSARSRFRGPGDSGKAGGEPARASRFAPHFWLNCCGLPQNPKKRAGRLWANPARDGLGAPFMFQYCIQGRCASKKCAKPTIGSQRPSQPLYLFIYT